MKRSFLLIPIAFGIAAFLFTEKSVRAQNTDSIFYAGLDTVGLAKTITEDEANWRWTDTLELSDFDKIDSVALSNTKKYKTISNLSQDLTSPYTKNEDKIRSIFIWMVGNIAYDEIELANNKKRKGEYKIRVTGRDTPSEVTKKFEDHYYDYATKVLRNKRGICEGYATLFYELCRAAGVDCDVVWGYADNDVIVVEKYKKRNACPTVHAWNKVKINGQWAYVDVTWASKSVYNGRRYEADTYNPKYYLTAEDRLYDTHIENKKRTIRRNELVGNFK